MGKQFEALKASLLQHDEDLEINMEDSKVKGAFVVMVNGTAIHDRLKGDGMVDSPAKLKKITDAIDVAKHEANTADSCTNVKKK